MSTGIHILVADDNPRMVRTLADIFRIKGYCVHSAHSAQEALEMVKTEAIDCVLSDIRMPGVNGVGLCRAIKERRPLLPVVLMTAYSDDRLVRSGLKEGATAILPKPLDINAILSFFSSLRTKRSIAIVDHDPDFRVTAGDILSERGFSVTTYTDSLKALKILNENIDMIFFGMKPGGVNGLDGLKKIRERHPRMPIILVTGCQEEMAAPIESALAMGAHACLYKPLQTGDLLAAVTDVYYRDLDRVLPA